MVNVVFQPGIEDEFREVEDELECLRDGDRVLVILVVVAMMLNPIAAALYLLEYRPLVGAWSP